MTKAARRGSRKTAQAAPRRRRRDRAAGGDARGASAAPAASRGLIARILDTPHAALVVRQLQPEVLHRVIQTCGLEDSADLVALATPDQLQRVFDLDLWRSERPGLDEQLDAGRFATWLEVLLEAGAAAAAERLAAMDPDLVIAALAQHVLVFDVAAVTPLPDDGGEPAARTFRPPERLSQEVGGYLLEARRTDAWDAIVDLLLALDAAHPGCFHRVMAGCRKLSNDGFELDGLDDLLSDRDQDLFDLAAGREERREQKGYVTPAQARAFLQSARQVDRAGSGAPPPSPIARAYFRAALVSDEPNAEADAPLPNAPALLPASGEPAAASVPGESPVSVDERTAAMATVLEVLVEAGVLNQAPRGLLAAAPDGERLARLHAQLEFAREIDPVAWSRRTEELAFLANALVAGCTLQSRSFTPKEASDAAAAVCNLGLENWPGPLAGETRGRASATADGGTAFAEDFLVANDLISAFQVGWTVLHEDVCVHVSERLAGVLAEVQTTDPEIRAGLDALRFELATSRRDGMPWRAGAALDAVIMLDKPAWAALVGLLAECPVLHAALDAVRTSSTRAIDPTAFEFISENRQIAAVREFMAMLPGVLRT
jgi:Family of unknown function (DUF6178)